MNDTQLDCRDCVTVTATDDSGYVAAAIQSCPRHKAAYVRRMLDAAAANPEIAAVQRMAAAARSRVSAS